MGVAFIGMRHIGKKKTTPIFGYFLYICAVKEVSGTMNSVGWINRLYGGYLP